MMLSVSFLFIQVLPGELKISAQTIKGQKYWVTYT